MIRYRVEITGNTPLPGSAIHPEGAVRVYWRMTGTEDADGAAQSAQGSVIVPAVLGLSRRQLLALVKKDPIIADYKARIAQALAG